MGFASLLSPTRGNSVRSDEAITGFGCGAYARSSPNGKGIFRCLYIVTVGDGPSQNAVPGHRRGKEEEVWEYRKMTNNKTAGRRKS